LPLGRIIGRPRRRSRAETARNRARIVQALAELAELVQPSPAGAAANPADFPRSANTTVKVD